MSRILVTGASGFLGWYIVQELQDRHDICAIHHQHPIPLERCTGMPLDITDEARVHAALRAWRPEVVVHAAAVSDLDQCERMPEEAYRVNVEGTAHVARAAREVGARLIYLSTDMVYDGGQGSYVEEDAAHPLMWYGQTKLEAEARARMLCEDVVILRLALLYGRGHGARLSFSDWLAARLQTGQEVPLFIDQYRSPLFVAQAAEVIGRLVQERGVRGLFNLGGGERIDRYAFGRTFCQVCGLSTDLLRPVRMEAVGQAAQRPRDCSMNSAKLSARLSLRLLTVREGLEHVKWGETGELDTARATS
jgi:dTDP-4-dehydrorhamnose reductase